MNAESEMLQKQLIECRAALQRLFDAGPCDRCSQDVDYCKEDYPCSCHDDWYAAREAALEALGSSAEGSAKARLSYARLLSKLLYGSAARGRSTGEP